MIYKSMRRAYLNLNKIHFQLIHWFFPRCLFVFQWVIGDNIVRDLKKFLSKQNVCNSIFLFPNFTFYYNQNNKFDEIFIFSIAIVMLINCLEPSCRNHLTDFARGYEFSFGELSFNGHRLFSFLGLDHFITVKNYCAWHLFTIHSFLCEFFFRLEF